LKIFIIKRERREIFSRAFWSTLLSFPVVVAGANFARAFTVQFGSCKFPENFTGCQDLAKQKKVPFISEDIALECEGKDKYKCGSNVFWKW
jgi:photosystem I subunit PsaN